MVLLTCCHIPDGPLWWFDIIIECLGKTINTTVMMEVKQFCQRLDDANTLYQSQGLMSKMQLHYTNYHDGQFIFHLGLEGMHQDCFLNCMVLLQVLAGVE